MEKIIVREKKIILIAGIVETLLFSVCLLLSLLVCIGMNGSFAMILCVFVFGGLTFLGIFFICCYYNRSVIISDAATCIYSDWKGRKTEFQFSEVSCCTLNVYLDSYTLRDANDKKLARFEIKMLEATTLISYLEEQNIVFTDAAKVQKFEKIIGNIDEHKQKQEIVKIHTTWDKKRIKRFKKILHKVQIVHSILLVVCFFTLPIRWELLIFAITPLFYYAVYLWMYPVMICEIKKGDKAGWKNAHVVLPFVPIGLSMLVLILSTSAMNVRNYNVFFILVFVFSIILFLPYIMISRRRDLNIRKRKWVSVFFALLLYSFSSSFAWNFVCRIEDPTHENAQVVEKDIYRSRKTTDYQVLLRRYGGEEVNLDISRSLYEMITEKTSVKICKRKSIFGLEFWSVDL